MIRAAIVGYGNIGRYTLEALEASEDFEIAGVVRRNASADGFPELAGYKVVSDITELGKVDVGGGGTVAKFIAQHNVDTVDIGVPVISMHAPYEVVAKTDVYMTHKAIEAFFAD